jgi:hypothetical protein
MIYFLFKFNKNKNSLFLSKVWFQNRRIKWRRQTLDDQQQRLTTLAGNIQAPPAINDEHHNSDSDE